MEHSLHNKVKIEFVLEGIVRTADGVGAIIDTAGFESLEYVMQVSAALVGGGFVMLLEESDVVTFGGEETVVSAEETLGTLPSCIATDTDFVARVGVIGKKRFQRATLTETGTVTAGIVSVIGILGHPKNAPTDEQVTEPA